jgi:hypothetical protein
VPFSGRSPFSLETCTQIASNVDFGRARGPECQGRLLGSTSGTAVLPALGLSPCQGVEAGLSAAAPHPSSNAL